MIELLKISNLALMHEACIEFKEGFTAVTGETGAGKSVLLGALSILAGNRCGKEVVRAGADFCKVEAVLSFADTSTLDALLAEADIPACEENALVISRSIERAKAGKCFINGALAPLNVLARLGAFWIDFHGPGEPQKLFHAKNQLDMLDAYARLNAFKRDYVALYETRAAALKKADELSSLKSLSADEAEFIKTQIALIDAADPEDEKIAALEEDFKLAERAAELAEKSSTIAECINGEDGVCDKLSNAARLSSEIADACEAAQSLAARINSASIELADIAAEFESLAGRSASFTHEELAEIRGRMDAWLNVSRKYGRTAAVVRKARADMAQKLEGQSDVKSAVEALKNEAAAVEEKLRPIAKKILDARLAAAKKLASDVEGLLLKLGFKKPKFSIDISAQAEITLNCGSVCEFMFSANAGQEALPLAKIASSGELARVMLALKAVLASSDGTPLLVFDEVDANVGGEIGAHVGAELRKLSNGRQVLCVTHLPQVAALAQNHMTVEKIQDDSSTSVKIASLNPLGEERVKELARMLGDRNAPSALSHAKKLLSF